jgi:hypothetical protein
VDPDEVQRHFVDSFTESKTRADLYTKWLEHREALTAIIPIQHQWVDGSYVTAAVNPRDVDVVTFIDGPTFESLSLGARLIAQSLLAGHQTRDTWGIDSFAIPVYPQSHAQHSVTLATMQEWTKVFGRGRDGIAKGFLEVGA